MRGIADDIDATRAHVLRGDVSHAYARSQVERGQHWLEGLGARRNHPGFVEEAEEVDRAVARLLQAVDKRWPDYVRLLYIPARDTGMKHLETTEVAVNAAAALHLRQAGATEVQVQRNVIPSRSLLTKSVEVRRYDQGWVQRTRRKRARVEVAYELVIGGKHVLIGSKRYVMRQAHWAAMCDMNGQLPELERLTGLAKRRALYKARKARRKQPRRRWRMRPRRKPNVAKGRHGDRRERHLVPAVVTKYIPLELGKWIRLSKTIMLNPGLG